MKVIMYGSCYVKCVTETLRSIYYDINSIIGMEKSSPLNPSYSYSFKGFHRFDLFFGPDRLGSGYEKSE